MSIKKLSQAEILSLQAALKKIQGLQALPQPLKSVKQIHQMQTTSQENLTSKKIKIVYIDRTDYDNLYDKVINSNLKKPEQN